jgi:hypothetical protein
VTPLGRPGLPDDVGINLVRAALPHIADKGKPSDGSLRALRLLPEKVGEAGEFTVTTTTLPSIATTPPYHPDPLPIESSSPSTLEGI